MDLDVDGLSHIAVLLEDKGAELTTLKETSDRLFCTAVSAEWRYAVQTLAFDAMRTALREAMIKTFANDISANVSILQDDAGNSIPDQLINNAMNTREAASAQAKGRGSMSDRARRRLELRGTGRLRDREAAERRPALSLRS